MYNIMGRELIIKSDNEPFLFAWCTLRPFDTLLVTSCTTLALVLCQRDLVIVWRNTIIHTIHMGQLMCIYTHNEALSVSLSLL